MQFCIRCWSSSSCSLCTHLMIAYNMPEITSEWSFFSFQFTLEFNSHHQTSDSRRNRISNFESNFTIFAFAWKSKQNAIISMKAEKKKEEKKTLNSTETNNTIINAFPICAQTKQHYHPSLLLCVVLYSLFSPVCFAHLFLFCGQIMSK